MASKLYVVLVWDFSKDCDCFVEEVRVRTRKEAYSFLDKFMTKYPDKAIVVYVEEVSL